MKQINIGLIGLGTIGTGVVKTLQQNRELISQRIGLTFNITKIADLDLATDRGISLADYELTTDANEIVNSPDIDIVIELIGGYDKANEFITKALNNKKHVITANKALLCLQGKKLFELAQKNRVNLLYEASVGGGIPIIKAIKESLQANRINSLYGIINGTANYILSNMSEKNISFLEALDQATAKGYAESDPSLDVEGIDSGHKLVILASLCFDTWIDYDNVYVEGISHITAQDIQYAKELGYTIKLLAITKEDNDGIEVRVHPTFVPQHHPLASVNGTFNAVCINGNIIGETLFYGKGAGELPTASAVVSDAIDIAKNMRNNEPLFSNYHNREYKNIKSIDKVSCKAYLKIMVEDKPGVLAQIATILGEQQISISSVIQKEEVGGTVPLILMIHKAKSKNIKAALEKISKLSIVRDTITMIRVEGEE